MLHRDVPRYGHVRHSSSTRVSVYGDGMQVMFLAPDQGQCGHAAIHLNQLGLGSLARLLAACIDVSPVLKRLSLVAALK